MKKYVFFIILGSAYYAEAMDLKRTALPTLTEKLNTKIDTFEKAICADILALDKISNATNIRTSSKEITDKRISKFNTLLVNIASVPIDTHRIALTSKLIKANNNCVEQLLYLINKFNKQYLTRHKSLKDELQNLTDENRNIKSSLNWSRNTIILLTLVAIIEALYIIKMHTTAV